MKMTKRILAFVLCFAMLVGLMPMVALRAEAAGTLIDAAIFCSDVHGNPSTVTSVFNGIKSADSTFNPTTVSFVGDTQTTASSVTSAAQEVYSSVQCIYAFGNHDDEGDYGIDDFTGLSYGSSSTNYYIYTISENSMSSSSPDTSGFTSTVEGLDKTKPLFIISHMPLHARRNDNNGAAAWYTAISAAAESMDIFFFWAHNHTSESDVDTAAYYVAKNGNETISIQGGSTVTPNFTYANAGYIDPPNTPARNNVATAVRIYDDSVNLTVYNGSGELSGTYAVNETVTRQFAGTTDSGDGDSGSTDETTVPTEGETTTEEKEVYVLVDTMTVGEDYLIANGNTGTVTLLGQSSGSAQTTTAEVKTSGDYTYIETADSGYVWNATESTNSSASGPRLINAETYAMYYSSGLAFSSSLTSTSGAVYTRYWTYSDGQLACASTNSSSTTYYLTYSDGYSMTSTATDGIYIYEKQTITVSSDGTVSGGGSTEGGTDEDDTTTGGSTDTVYGDGTYTTADDGSYQKVTFGSTTTEKKTVYKLTSSITSGTAYLIANSNSAGSAYVVANNSGEVDATGVTVVEDDTIGTYIELTDATDELWTASGSSSTTLKNGNYYLYGSGSDLSLSSSNSRTWSWSSSNSRLSYTSGSGKNQKTYYLVYGDSGWDTTQQSDNVYFYVPTEIETTVDTTKTYSVTASDIEHFLDSDDTTAETATITASVTEGTPEGTYTYEIVEGGDDIIADIDDNGVITFNGNKGTVQVKVSYTWTEGENTYTIWQVIDVTATAPYYAINLHEAELTQVSITEFAEGVTYYTFNETTNTYDVATAYVEGTTYYTTPVIKGDEITAPIALKGIEKDDTYAVWAVVKEYNGEYPEGNDLGDVDDSRLYWSVSDPSIATIDPTTGVITFTGTNYGTFEVTVHYLDENGESLCEDTIIISATESLYVVPGDGTNDFPEYPEQGAIRFDKTAVAQGNFSESGIAKVELSMTGVPYGTNVKTDVVIMVDMTASMSDDDVTAAELAIQELIESLVYDEENDKYDSNIQLFVDVFYSASSDSDFATEEYLNCVTISNATELAAAKALIDFTQSSNGGGTRYNLAMKDVYGTLTRDGHAEKQFVVFVSDGVPTAYAPLSNGTLGTTITGSNSTTDSLADGWFDLTTGAVTDEFETEYYSYLIKTAGISMYTVGCNLTALTEPALVLDHMSSNYSADGKTATGETKYSFFCTTSGGITDEVLEIFQGIGEDIREAATDVVVEDKIDSHYTMNFSLPSGVTAAEAGDMDDFYIQVLGYELDENNDRKADPTVLEKFLFNSDGTVTHTIGSTTCEDCTHVTYTDGVVTGIDGTYFDYTIDANGDEFLTWTAEKLDRTELALEYFVYLDHSAGNVDAADQVDPGTYPTNEYATITYKNFNGKECQQYFPVPTMTWMGAKVTYVFYLVNEDGQPVNRAGKVIPFAEAIFVTDPVTYDVTWNEDKGIERLSADYLADGLVPDVYALYDEKAYYEIRVYQTEGVDEETKAVNYNYFVISGADDKLIDSALDTDTTVDNSTTKVYNTKAGNKYDKYGVYSQQSAGTVLNTTYVDENGNETAGTVTTTVQTDGIDYANTTVAFAVVWKPELVPDTVVIDYGLDVVIDVTTNDSLSSGVTGVSTTAPANVEPNSGTYKTGTMGTSTDILIGDLIVGTAKVENLNAVRFSLNKSTGMQFTESVDFYYESECNYYTYDGEDRTLNTAFMYSKVTVIPATTIYYEDEYVTLTTHTKQEDGSYDVTSGWPASSNAATAEQDVDRPGEGKISEAYDADNNYGYDSAYTSMSTYSMGKAAMITVTPTVEGQANFDFYGTGFDVISMTDTTTGTIVVQVYAYDEDGICGSAPIKSYAVDTYYGYAKGPCKVTYTYKDGEWVMTSEETVDSLGESQTVPTDPAEGDTYYIYTEKWYNVSSNDPNALYQVPVMKVEGLDYGKYRAQIVVFYDTFFDHVSDDSAYDFYLDAIRIYDPTGNQDDVANDAYIEDGEAFPEYTELRDLIISANDFNNLTDSTISGLVFIDGQTSGAANTSSITDYTSYGPNNELYLAAGQAVAGDLDAGNAASVQLAIKTVGGSADVEVYGVDANNNKTVAVAETISTATDLYYDITDLNGMTLVIKNAGTSGMISITNIKCTYGAAPVYPVSMVLTDTGATVTYSNNATKDVADSALKVTANEDGTATYSYVEKVNSKTYTVSVTTEAAAAASVMSLSAEEEETPSLYLLSVNRSTASTALMSLREEETEPETTEPETEPTEPEITVPEETEPEETEPETTVPEETEPETTVPEETEPSTEEQVQEIVEKVTEVIKKIFGWLFG